MKEFSKYVGLDVHKETIPVLVEAAWTYRHATYAHNISIQCLSIPEFFTRH